MNPKIKGHQNILTREILQKFKPPVWSRQVIVEADADFAAKKTQQLIDELNYFYVFALPRTWKTISGQHLSMIARHNTPRHSYHRMALYKLGG
ncbi:MAG: hypothetical protein AB7U82_30475 [Blastocatellales bacterium]